MMAHSAWFRGEVFDFSVVFRRSLMKSTAMSEVMKSPRCELGCTRSHTDWSVEVRQETSERFLVFFPLRDETRGVCGTLKAEDLNKGSGLLDVTAFIQIRHRSAFRIDAQGLKPGLCFCTSKKS